MKFSWAEFCALCALWIVRWPTGEVTFQAKCPANAFDCRLEDCQYPDCNCYMRSE